MPAAFMSNVVGCVRLHGEWCCDLFGVIVMHGAPVRPGCPSGVFCVVWSVAAMVAAFVSPDRVCPVLG